MINFFRNLIDKRIVEIIKPLEKTLDRIDENMNKKDIDLIELTKEIVEIKNKLKSYKENKKQIIDFNVFYTILLAIFIPKTVTDVTESILTLDVKFIFSLNNFISVIVSTILILIYLIFSYNMQLMNVYLNDLESYLLRIEIKYDTIIAMSNTNLITNTHLTNLNIKKLYIAKRKK